MVKFKKLSLSFSFARFPTGSFLYTFILTQQDTYPTSNIYRSCFILAKNHRRSSVFPVFYLVEIQFEPGKKTGME